MIEFDRTLKQIQLKRSTYYVFDTRLKFDGRIFDPTEETDVKKGIQEAIWNRYWDMFNKFYLSGHNIVIIKLSGLHFNITDVLGHMFTNDSRTQMILHYRNWQIDENGTKVGDSFAMFRCNRDLFKTLFDEFWFALGFELRFQGIVLKRERISDMEKWSRRNENQRTESDLIRMASVLFDNQHNGFHFRIISNAKHSRFINRCIKSL